MKSHRTSFILNEHDILLSGSTECVLCYNMYKFAVVGQRRKLLPLLEYPWRIVFRTFSPPHTHPEPQTLYTQVLYIKWCSICIRPVCILPYSLNHLQLTQNTQYNVSCKYNVNFIEIVAHAWQIQVQHFGTSQDIFAKYFPILVGQIHSYRLCRCSRPTMLLPGCF